jgi:hypothetical protein
LSLLTATLATKIVIGVLAGGVAATGATTAAAYTGTLPVALQQAAHDTIGAPAPTTSETELAAVDPTATPDPTGTPAPAKASKLGGPDATGPAAHGLCNAYAHGGLSATSTAYAALVRAAGDAGTITSYCATIPAPGKAAATHPETSEPTPPAVTPDAKDDKAATKSAAPKGTKATGKSSTGKKNK